MTLTSQPVSASRYVIGMLFLVSLLAGLGFTSHRLRCRYLRPWEGPLAILAELLTTLWLLVVLAQTLGALRLLRPIPFLIAVLLLAYASFRYLPVTPTTVEGVSVDRPSRVAFSGKLQVALALAGAVLVLRRWWLPTTDVLSGYGIVGYDSLWTHLPFAANFFQEGAVLSLYFPGSLPETYLPLNAELLHSVGMVAFENDLLSPLFSLAWAAIALLAGWCFGRRWNVAPLALIAAAMVLDFPVLLDHQPGQAMNDVAVLALLLCAMTFLVHANGNRPALLLAAAATGLAMGTQVTTLLIIAVLTAGVMLVARGGNRWSTLGLWTAGVLSTGGLWYVRNAFATGNPLPWVKLGLGRFSLPAIPSALADCGNAALVDRWSDPTFRQTVVSEAFATGLGRKWPLVALLAGAGLLSGIIALRGGGRLAAIAGTTAMVGYLFTPATAGRPDNAFHCTAYNTRFATFGLVAGLLCLGAVASRSPRMVTVLFGGLVALLVLYDSDSAGSLLVRSVFMLLVAFVVVAIHQLIERRSPRYPSARSAVGMAIAAYVVVAAAGWPVADGYATRRYAGPTLQSSIDEIGAWAQGVRGRDIAVAGTFMAYPLYGPDLSNRIVYPHTETRRGTFKLVNDCDAWRRLLRQGRYDYVVVVAEGSTEEPKEAAWTAGDPGAVPVLRDGASTLFRFDARSGSSRCTQ